MLNDIELRMSNAQVVTESAASTDYIDMLKAGDAVGEELYLIVQVDEAADSSGDAATVTIALQTDDNSSFSSPKTLYSTAAIAQASVTLYSRPVAVRIPAGAERYLRVYYTIGTENLTKGKFTAFLTAAYNKGL